MWNARDMRTNVTHPSSVRYGCACGALVVAVAGCASAARVQLSAARSLDTLTGAVQQAVDELHDEVLAADRRRRVNAVDAFVLRIRNDHADPQRTDAHVSAFHDALDRLRADADVEFARHLATIDNLRAIKEIADGLRELGVQSMSLDDDVRRYVTDLFDRPQSDASNNGS